MKKIMKIKWPLLIAIFATCAGYVNKPLQASPKDMHTYAYWQTVSGRYYYLADCTDNGWVQGLDYDCVPGYICTFIANPLNSHSDLTGNYFYITDVPASGVNYDGSFELF